MKLLPQLLILFLFYYLVGSINIINVLYAGNNCSSSDMFGISTYDYQVADKSGVDGCVNWVVGNNTNSYESACTATDVYGGATIHNVTLETWINSEDCPTTIEPNTTTYTAIHECVNEEGVSRKGRCMYRAPSSWIHVQFYDEGVYDGCNVVTATRNLITEMWLIPNMCLNFDYGVNNTYWMKFFNNRTHFWVIKYSSSLCNDDTVWRREYAVGVCTEVASARRIIDGDDVGDIFDHNVILVSLPESITNFLVLAIVIPIAVIIAVIGVVFLGYCIIQNKTPVSPITKNVGLI